MKSSTKWLGGISLKNERLKRLRLRNGFTQEALANKANIKFSTYVKKENGLTKFSVEEALIISRILGCSIEDIFLETKQPNGYKKEEN